VEHPVNRVDEQLSRHVAGGQSDAKAKKQAMRCVHLVERYCVAI
jgi:hypothetical protein